MVDSPVQPERRFLALVFPMLPLERVRATRPHLFVDGVDAPVALTERVGGVERLAMVDPAAARAGLAPGDHVAAARAALPELVLLPADPHADCDWLERLAEGFARYTPQVRLDPADGLTLDLSARPEGEDAALAADITTRMARRGLVVRHAFGATPAVARALARFAGGAAPDEAGAVRRLPVAALALETEDEAALLAAGLRTVGEVAARPQKALVAQFGRAVAAAVRDLTDARQTLPPMPIWPDREVERRCDPPIWEAKPVLAAIEAAVCLLAKELTAAGEGGCDWEAALFTGDGQRVVMRVERPEPAESVGPVLRAFAGQAAGLADRLAAGGGCDLLRVRVARAAPIGTGRLALEGGAAVRPDRPPPARRAPRPLVETPPQLGLALTDPAPPPEPARGDGVDAPPRRVRPREAGLMPRGRAVRRSGLPLRRVPPQIASQHKWEH